jgi:ribosomal-protein-alanine N-acetyltransferase
MNFRAMKSDDLEAVLAAEAVLHPFPWTQGNFADSLKAEHGMWVATEDDALVAYAVTTQVLDEAHLLNISVLPERQRAGRGGRFLNHLLDTAKKTGAAHMYLEVRSSNHAAHQLYLKHEFIQIGRRKGYYPALNGREDAIVMAREL